MLSVFVEYTDLEEPHTKHTVVESDETKCLNENREITCVGFGIYTETRARRLAKWLLMTYEGSNE